MGNSTFGPLARKAIGWILVIAVAIIAFKLVIAIVAGLAQTLFAVTLIVVVVLAALWVVRRL